MAKNLSVSMLMDFYGGLLTDKQRDALELYYNQDFSLAEIAENMDISRQGVRDFIKRGEKQLEDFEEALGLSEKFSQMNKELNTLENGLAALLKLPVSKSAAELIVELSELVRKMENEL